MRLLSQLTQTCLTVGLLSVALTATAQEPGTASGEWPSYGGDLTHQRYSPLDQITAENFSDLDLAWRFNTDNLGPRSEGNFQSTPLMVNGMLYSTAGSRRSVVALDPETGEERKAVNIAKDKFHRPEYRLPEGVTPNEHNSGKPYEYPDGIMPGDKALIEKAKKDVEGCRCYIRSRDRSKNRRLRHS